MTTYVLILIIFGTGGAPNNYGPATTVAEFSSKENCEKANKDIIDRLDGDRWPYKYAFCEAK